MPELNNFSGVELFVEIENIFNTDLKEQFIIKANLSLYTTEYNFYQGGVICIMIFT